MKTLARIVIACAVLASIAAMVIAYRSNQANTIAVAAALIALMTLIATVALQSLSKGRGLLQDQVDGALHRLESDVRRFWNTEAADRGLTDNPIRIEIRAAPAPDEAVPLPAATAELGGIVEQRSGRGLTAWLGRLFGTDAAEARADAADGIAPSITDPDERKVTIHGMAAEWRGSAVRRFLLLGEPGSGKTSVLVNLLRTLANDKDRIERGRHPVPVFVSASGWDPSVPFHEWLREQLEREYRYLARRHRRSAGDRERASIASELVASGLVIPFIDGIDEITEKDGRRREAIKRLNADPVFADAPLAVTCRTADYRREEQDGEFGLNRVREYELQPLEWQQAAAYLCRSEPTDGLPRTVPSRWRPVVEELARGDRSAPLAEVMATPLMVFLARAAFDDPDGGPQPVELLEFRTRSELEQRLAGEYLKAAYRPSAGRPLVSGRRLRNTEKILAFIANHLHESGKTDFVWWQMTPPENQTDSEYLTRHQRPGSTIEKFVIMVGKSPTVMPMDMSILTFLYVISFGGIFFCQMLIMLGVMGDLSIPMRELVLVWVALFLVMPVFAIKNKRRAERETVIGPYRLYLSDKRMSRIMQCLIVLGVGLPPLLAEFGNPVTTGTRESLWWLRPAMLTLVGVALATTVTRRFIATPRLDTAVMRRRVKGALPWSPPFMRTLEDARERHVLRQVGGAYQFRHRVIQEYLAEQVGAQPFLG